MEIQIMEAGYVRYTVPGICYGIKGKSKEFGLRI